MNRTSRSSGSTTTVRGRGIRSQNNTNVGRGGREVKLSNTGIRGNPAPTRRMWNSDVTQESDNQNRNRTDPANEARSNPVYAGGFSVQAPDEQRRKKITEQAQREMENYEAHKEQKKITRVSYVGTVGGGEKNITQARKEMMQSQANAKLQRLQKQQRWKEEKKSQEEALISQKKMQAREQAELKEKRERERQEKWKEDMRRKNSAFLDRLEKNNQAPQPAQQEPENASGVAMASAVQNKRSVEKLPPQRLRQLPPQPKPCQPSPQLENEDLSVDYEANVPLTSNPEIKQLQGMFPNYPLEVIRDILQQMGNLDAAASFLMDMEN